MVQKFFGKKKFQDALDQGKVEQVIACQQQDDGKPYASNWNLIFEHLNEKLFKDCILIGTDKISYKTEKFYLQ